MKSIISKDLIHIFMKLCREPPVNNQQSFLYFYLQMNKKRRGKEGVTLNMMRTKTIEKGIVYYESLKR